MPADVQIEAPRPYEAEAISALALRSKAHWGYDAAFIEACRAELTYTSQDCRSGEMFVARVGGVLTGFGRVAGAAPEGELASLVVDPPWMGRGIGRRLLGHALDIARSRGMTRLCLDADPEAEAFYARHGARRIGQSPSGSIPGRVLPHMEFTLTREPEGATVLPERAS